MTKKPLLRRYRFKLYPSTAQKAALDDQRQLHCDLYNALLQQRIEAYRRRGKGLSFFDQSKEITALRADDPRYAALSRGSMNGTAQRLDHAYTAFFARAKRGAGASSGFPRFQNGSTYPGFDLGSHKKGWSIVFNGRKSSGLYVKGIDGTIKARGALPDGNNTPHVGTIIYRDGRYWLSLVVKATPRHRPGRHDITITLDLITQFASVTTTKASGGRAAAGFGVTGTGNHPTTSRDCAEVASGTPDLSGNHGGHTFEVNPPAASGTQELLHKMQQMAELQTQMAAARQRQAWGRYRRLKSRHQHLTARQARQRRENLHCWTTALIRAATSITIIAPPSIAALTKSGKGTKSDPGALVSFKAQMNRRILDFTPAEAIAQLTYKAAEAGIALAQIASATTPAAAPAAITAAARTAKRIMRKAHKS